MPHSPHASFPQASYPHQSTQLLPQHSATPAHTSYEQHRATTSRSSVPVASANTYNPPRPIEVFHLTDNQNTSIPQDIREQFQRDEFGHVLFFTAPPLDVSRIPERTAKLGHSLKYLAKKARNEEALKLKRKERDELKAVEAENSRKRARVEEQIQQESSMQLGLKALDVLSKNMELGTEKIYQDMYGDQWKEAKQAGEMHLLSIQEAEKTKAEGVKKI